MTGKEQDPRFDGWSTCTIFFALLICGLGAFHAPEAINNEGKGPLGWDIFFLQRMGAYGDKQFAMRS